MSLQTTLEVQPIHFSGLTGHEFVNHQAVATVISRLRPELLLSDKNHPINTSLPPGSSGHPFDNALIRETSGTNTVKRTVFPREVMAPEFKSQMPNLTFFSPSWGSRALGIQIIPSPELAPDRKIIQAAIFRIDIIGNDGKPITPHKLVDPYSYQTEMIDGKELLVFGSGKDVLVVIGFGTGGIRLGDVHHTPQVKIGLFPRLFLEEAQPIKE